MCDQELEKFTDLEHFDSFLKVMSFYHTERCEHNDCSQCEHNDCSQCFFVLNLRYLYTENRIQQKDSVETLKNYCRMRKMQFMCTRLFIYRLALAEIEKQRIELEKSFNRMLQIWNNTKSEVPSSLPNIQK